MAWTCGRRDPESMKTKRILSIIGSTLLVLSPTNWAVAHGGGGGGGFGGGGFGGGGGHGGGGGGHFGGGGGFRGGGMAFHGSGIGFRGGGAGFRSAGPRFGNGRRAFANQATPQSRTFGRGDFNRRIAAHTAERHDANWHRDWDRRHAHFFHNRFFVFDDGFWFGLDGYPYDDYYAYDDQDYYGYDASTDPYSVSTVSAVQSDLAKQGYYRGVIDGIYGPQTRVAITRYQSKHGLQVTGSLTPATLESLGMGS